MIIELTEEQKNQLTPLLEKASADSKMGKPGIVIAQVWRDSIEVGFLPHEKAKFIENKAEPA